MSCHQKVTRAIATSYNAMASSFVDAVHFVMPVSLSEAFVSSGNEPESCLLQGAFTRWVA